MSENMANRMSECMPDKIYATVGITRSNLYVNHGKSSALWDFDIAVENCTFIDDLIFPISNDYLP